MDERIKVMHSARVLLFHTDPSGKFTTNSNKNIQFGIFALWKTTHLLKELPN